MKAKDCDGFYYMARIHDLKQGYRPYKYHKGNPYTIQNIKHLLTIENRNIMLLSNEYENSYTKMHVKCLIDGYEWYSTSGNLIAGNGCRVCAKNYTPTFEEFKSDILHKYYDKYKNLNFIKESYKTISNYMIVENQYGACWIKPEKMKIGRTPTIESALCPNLYFKNQAKEIHGNKYDYSKVEYNGSRVDVIIICKEHGEFLQKPANHLNGHGCSHCSVFSMAEVRICEVLNKYNINHVRNKKFHGLVGVRGGSLSYDFYLPNFNILIEAQGQQHEKSIPFFGGEENFNRQKEHDKRKYNYATTNNYDLFEIWYYDYKNIENMLINKLNLKDMGV